MRALIITLALCCLPSLAAAQADIIARPSQSPTRVQTVALGTGMATCLVFDGADHLNVSNHFECQPSSEGSVTDHTITIIEGDGDVTVRAVTVRAGVVSDPSPNFKRVQDVPPAPVLLSGEGGGVGDAA